METNETVTLTYMGTTLRVARGSLLSDAVGMELPCGAHGRCGKCKIIARGALSPVTDDEQRHLTEEEQRRGVRLACKTRILGDAVAEPIPSGGAMTDAEILTGGSTTLDAHEPILRAYGVALDIGTTTLAARLYDRDGRLLSEAGAKNPQIRFGADVISRVEAALNGKARALAEAIRGGIDRLLLSLAGRAGVTPREIDTVVVTGNSAMLSLLTETDPTPFSRAPFRLERKFGERISAEEAGFSVLSPDAAVVLPPVISAFVGADTVSAILASGLLSNTDTELLLDVGTNGEMALSSKGHLYVASTAAGPAFEGVGISMGMNAAAGAIDRVTVDGDGLSVRVIGGGIPTGICGSGLIDAVASLVTLGRIDETGYMEEDPAVLSGSVTLTGKDVRMVQLAKSAISAGVRTLLHTAGDSVSDVSRVVVAGGFGCYLDFQNAETVGLFPKGLGRSAEAVGNAALDGAAMLLLSRSEWENALRIASRAELVDLATSAVFMEHYVEDMGF